LEPWGFEADNWRAGLITSMVANTVRDPKKRRKPFLPSDFMPEEDGPHESSWEDIKNKSMGVFALLGGRMQEGEPDGSG